MHLVILDDNYPSPDNIYSDVFAHIRAKEYAVSNDVVVLSSFDNAGQPYIHEGIKVRPSGSIENITSQLAELSPDAVLVHFATFPIIRDVILSTDHRFVIWVHGFEVTGWFRRLYEYRNPLHFLRYIKGNIVQRRHFGRLILESNRTGRIRFVFVSEWIRNVAAADCGVWPLNSSVISNPIDDRLFVHRKKSAGDRFKVLILRPFTGKKYATDIMTKAMLELDRRGEFGRFEFDVWGNGSSSSEMNRLFAGRTNIRFSDDFVGHASLPRLHEQNGVMLAVSRQDTHGVSACEAMASGVVPISSHNSAIPEYMSHGISCLLTDNRPSSVANALVRLADDPDLYLRLSEGAAREVRRKSAVADVVRRELEVVKSISPAA